MFNGKIHYKWQFSIAMLVYQRVYVIHIYIYIYIGETPQCCLWFSLTSIDACYPHDIESLLFLVNHLKPAFLLVNSQP